MFGAGVDLRFCAVRADYVPEALQEAQHLERISLTRGLDDPAALEEVDVLVPGGVVGAPPPPAVAAFTGVGRLFPTARRSPEGEPSESVLALSVVARDRSATGWSWTAAAYGEAPRRLSVPDLAKESLRLLGRAFGVEATPEPAGPAPEPAAPTGPATAAAPTAATAPTAAAPATAPAAATAAAAPAGDAGAGDSGAADAGAGESGAADSGAGESGAADSG